MKKIKKMILTGLLSLSFMGTVLVFYPQEAKADWCSGTAVWYGGILVCSGNATNCSYQCPPQ